MADKGYSSNKRYYWLKLKKDFFKQRIIKKLRRQKDGDTMTLIYLKMQLLAIENDGRILLENLEDSVAEEIALELDEDAEIMERLLTFLENYKLVEVQEDGSLFIPEVEENTGSESKNAEVMRARRKKNNSEITSDNKGITSDNNVIPMLSDCYQTDNTTDEMLSKRKEIRDKRKEKKEKEKEILSFSQDVISYLNKVTGSSFRFDSNASLSYIKARFNQGYTDPELYKDVIKVKADEWMKQPTMAKYLRPSTLFGNKFENYVQEANRNRPNRSDDVEFVNPAFVDDTFEDDLWNA